VVRIDVISDLVCPWCYVGKKKLALALATQGGAHTVVFHPFELDPGISPGAGEDYKARLARKLGGLARLEAGWARLTEIGQPLGISFAFERIARAQSTLDGHRLLAWALEAGGPALQDELAERLFSAHFERGLAIDDHAVLVAEAGAAGMDSSGLAERLASADDRARIRAEVAEAQQLGVSGVPTFVFAQRLAVSGAQEPATLLQAMAQAGA
jgi:predicted DsbA family dithiol-disulfide isomerase